MSKEQKKNAEGVAEKLTNSVKSEPKEKKSATTLKKSKVTTAKTSVSKPKKKADKASDLGDNKGIANNKLTDMQYGQEYLQETREHHEGLGDQWQVLVGNPARMMSQIINTVVSSGGTRAAWQRKDIDKEYIMLAWPADEPLRASVVISGEPEGDLKPITACPLLEGLPNDLEVDSVYAWENKAGANVAVMVEEGRNPMWMYTPVYFRDREALTPGVTHTFLVAGLAYGLRRALLDNITIAHGPQFKAHAEAWLAKNEGKSSLEVPPLQVNVAGANIILPGNNYCEYQIRCPILSVAHTKLEKVEVYMLHLRFAFETRKHLDIMVYVPTTACANGYVPKEGDEIDAYVWLQGRIIDHESAN